MTQTDTNPFLYNTKLCPSFTTEAKNNFNSSNRAKMEAEIEEEAPQASNVRSRYIKKRALKNKALAVSFDEKDLKDYVTGFHKRKKKRRKEAEKNQEEALRRKRVECRAKRKLERASVYGGGVDSAPDENEEYCDEDEETEPVASVAGIYLFILFFANAS
ncbi:hypothetical protein EZV62_026588 [Acer yangbiense]|uniref:Ribosomal RNA-processing protein 17 n=1 Tax=Acer yangbiense TaxID=1000413 RepID=A0A5C7GR63_9ROSI|nr:hypothetical protein EZV62_026588 [Acer yangbiense]